MPVPLVFIYQGTKFQNQTQQPQNEDQQPADKDLSNKTLQIGQLDRTVNGNNKSPT